MSEDKFVPQATKISAEADRLLERLEQRTGISKYKILQMSIDTIIRYMDDRHNLTPEMERAMTVFEHLRGWNDAFNIADPAVQREVGEAIYFLQDPTGVRGGVRAVHVTKPFFDERTMTYNIKVILEHVIKLLAPERYAKLMQLAKDADCNDLLDVIDYLIDLHGNDSDTEELRKMFEDCNRHEWGRDYSYGNKTRRVHKRDIEKMGTIFNKEDNEDDV